MSSVFLRLAASALLIASAAAQQQPSQPTTTPPATADGPLVQSVVLATTPAELWRINTTVEGLQEWMVPFAHVDLRPGGSIETSYDGAARPGDPANIRQALLALQPERLLASRGAIPAPFAAQLDDPTIHGVLHIEAIDPRHTRFTTVMLGWGEGEAWQRARAFFVQGNAWYLQQLVERYAEDQAAQDSAAALLDAWSGAPWVAQRSGERWFVQTLGPPRTWLVTEQDREGRPLASALIATDPETGALARWRLDADGGSARSAVWAREDGALAIEGHWTDAAGVTRVEGEWLTLTEEGSLVRVQRRVQVEPFSADDAVAAQLLYDRTGASR